MKNDSNKEKREKLYAKTREELISMQKSNSETYDKSILSLSSAFLALSVAFIRDVVPLESASYTLLLYFSWLCFSGAILSTISSFIYGQKGIRKLMYAAEKYYLKEDQKAYEVSNVISRGIDRFNLASGVVFMLAIIFTVTFVITNSVGITRMSNENESERTVVIQREQSTNSFKKPTEPSTTKYRLQQSNQNTNNTGGNNEASR